MAHYDERSQPTNCKELTAMEARDDAEPSPEQARAAAPLGKPARADDVVACGRIIWRRVPPIFSSDNGLCLQVVRARHFIAARAARRVREG